MALRSARVALASAVACVALAGCAPTGAAAVRTVDVRGVVTQTSASDGPEGWILEADGGILLPIELPGAPEVGGHCVSIAVDAGFPDVTGQDDVVAALRQIVEETGEALQVTGFC